MHVAKGGQNNAHYTDGGRNLLWQDVKLQELLCRQWAELARRYRAEPAVAAYEILNEPGTEPRDPSLVVALNRKVIRAIRQVDPEKIIVVSGDDWSNARSVVDEIRVDDPNILYTVSLLRRRVCRLLAGQRRRKRGLPLRQPGMDGI